ncbi:MAG: hypothetical protein JWO69_1093 [Thermoleophilia bacterium]|nr:hypothetical protein [Thermoleophilia bacterium]
MMQQPSRLHSTNDSWSAAHDAAKVGADPVQRVVQHVEGPTLYNREPEFGRGLASYDRAPTCSGRSSRASASTSGPGRTFARRVASGAALLALALVVAGCGGEEVPVDAAPAAVDPALTTPAATNPDGTPVTPAATNPDGTPVTPGTPIAGGATDGTAAGDEGGDVPGLNEISGATATNGSTVKISALTPKQFKQAHCNKPILVVLYQPGSILDEKLLDEARTAKAKVPGTVQIIYTPKQVKSFGDLPAKLGLLSAPGVATVGRDGRIANFWTTYVDSDLILSSLRNAAKAKPCRLTSDDVPTVEAPSDLSNAAALVAGQSPAAPTPGTTAVQPAGDEGGLRDLLLS